MKKNTIIALCSVLIVAAIGWAGSSSIDLPSTTNRGIAQVFVPSTFKLYSSTKSASIDVRNVGLLRFRTTAAGTYDQGSGVKVPIDADTWEDLGIAEQVSTIRVFNNTSAAAEAKVKIYVQQR